MWWWAPTNAHHCAIQPTITLTTFLYCILQCTNNATSSCSKAINHKIKFSIITQKFPGGPFKFQEISRISRRVFKFQEISRISRISRSCRHPVKRRVRYDLRKYFFTERITNMWNSLPDVVVNASTVNQFKNNLDKHLRNQEIMYDYKAELSGVLSRSNNITDYQLG